MLAILLAAIIVDSVIGTRQIPGGTVEDHRLTANLESWVEDDKVFTEVFDRWHWTDVYYTEDGSVSYESKVTTSFNPTEYDPAGAYGENWPLIERNERGSVMQTYKAVSCDTHIEGEGMRGYVSFSLVTASEVNPNVDLGFDRRATPQSKSGWSGEWFTVSLFAKDVVYVSDGKYKFYEWSITGTGRRNVSDVHSNVCTMEAQVHSGTRTITARALYTFVPRESSVFVSVSHNDAGTATVSPESSEKAYGEYSSFVATATPNIGYRFVGWVINGVHYDYSQVDFSALHEYGDKIVYAVATFEPDGSKTFSGLPIHEGGNIVHASDGRIVADY